MDTGTITIKTKTYRLRLSEAGISKDFTGRGRENGGDHPDLTGVSVITVTNRPHHMAWVYENYLRQSHFPRELIIILNSNQMNPEIWAQHAPVHEPVKIFQLDESVSLGECLNYAVRQARYDYIAKFDDDDYYAPGFLSSGIRTSAAVNAHLLGKSCRYIYFEDSSTLGLYAPYPEHSYVDYVPGATMIIKKEVFASIQFPDLSDGEDTVFQQRCLEQGFSIYAADRFNYVTIRRQDKNTHTFKLDDESYMGLCQALIPTQDYRELISAPRSFRIKTSRGG